MPPAATAPPDAIAPPCAATPLTVSNCWAVLNSQSFVPSAVDTAYNIPLEPPWKTTPGMTVGAAPSAVPRPPAAGGGAVNDHAVSPLAGRNATRPAPPAP